MSNEEKSRALGMNFGTAGGRLRKLIMWGLVQETGQDVCFQCGRRIVNVDDLSIEHREPWQSADDPKAAFFDLENIAFSHLSCNSGESANRRKTHCPSGHRYTDENTQKGGDGRRHCRKCSRNQARQRRYDKE